MDWNVRRSLLVITVLSLLVGASSASRVKNFFLPELGYSHLLTAVVGF
jgi:hypothetical protein